MSIRVIGLLSISIALSACVSNVDSYRSVSADWASRHVQKADEELSKGKCFKAGKRIIKALKRPSGDGKVAGFFRSKPNALECYVSFLESMIFDVHNVNSVYYVSDVLKDSDGRGLIPSADIEELNRKLNKRIADGNFYNEIEFRFKDKIENYPVLLSFKHQNIIANREILSLQGDFNTDRNVAGLMRYLEEFGHKKEERKRIEALLPTFNIRRSEIDLVSKVFPVYAQKIRSEMLASVYLDTINIDRLMRSDIKIGLEHKAPNIEWLAIGSKKIVLEIEKVRHIERVLPESTRTITYSKPDVNFIGGLLLMPRNSSYIYELVTGGFEIDYGYVITMKKNDAVLYQKEMKGTEVDKYSNCMNARIQNVFGGTQAANFTANSDMELKCKGKKSVLMQSLRDRIVSKIVHESLKTPFIRDASN